MGSYQEYGQHKLQYVSYKKDGRGAGGVRVEGESIKHKILLEINSVLYLIPNCYFEVIQIGKAYPKLNERQS